MKYLFDVNVLLALGHQDHADHQKASQWFQSVAQVATDLLTCSITELAFVRISVQAGLEPDIASAQRTLAALKQSSRVPFQIFEDGLSASRMPKYVRSQSQLTDGHLLELAVSAGAKFVTLDRGIPGALIIN